MNYLKSSKNNYHFTKKQLNKKLVQLGLKKNDIVFSHSNLAFFGKIKEKDNICKIFLKTIFEIIGPNGTLIVPTFTYSINKIFNKKKTPSVCGVFSEYTRQTSLGLRSKDPIFSIYAIGKYAKYLTKIKSLNNYECFGEDSFFYKFYKLSGKIMNFNDTCASTHVHLFEKFLNVNYRKNKVFNCTILENSKRKKRNIIFYCVKNLRKNEARFDLFHKMSLKQKFAKQVKLGLGVITSMNIIQMKKVVEKGLKKNKNFLYRHI